MDKKDEYIEEIYYEEETPNLDPKTSSIQSSDHYVRPNNNMALGFGRKGQDAFYKDSLNNKKGDIDNNDTKLGQNKNRTNPSNDAAKNLATGNRNNNQNKNKDNKQNKDDKNSKNNKDNNSNSDKKGSTLKKENSKSGISSKDEKTSGVSSLKNKLNPLKRNTKHNTEEKNTLEGGLKALWRKIPLIMRIKILAIGGAVVGVLLIFLIIFAALMGSSGTSSNGTNCDSEATELDLQKYINTFEGSGGYCNDKEYKIYQNAGDRPTVGYGVTSDYVPGIDNKVGECVSIEKVDAAQRKAIDAKRSFIQGYEKKYNVKLANYQEDSLTAIAYNGCASYFDGIFEAIKKDDYKAIWYAMKDCNEDLLGLKRRRKADFALYVTGDYTEAEKYRTLSWTNAEYNNYDSEGVMARRDSMKTSCTVDGYVVPVENFSPNMIMDDGASCFGPRVHPIYEIAKWHYGIDISLAEGLPVLATANGTVITAVKAYDSSAGYGAYIVLKHDKKISSLYGHLSLVDVNVGDKVTQGQKIGEVGTTGASTGPHVHFEIWDGKDKVDPAQYVDLKGKCKYGNKS